MDEQVINAPVLVLGNKIDSPNAVSEDELRSVFRIRSTGKVSNSFAGNALHNIVANNAIFIDVNERRKLKRNLFTIIRCKIISGFVVQGSGKCHQDLSGKVSNI